MKLCSVSLERLPVIPPFTGTQSESLECDSEVMCS